MGNEERGMSPISHFPFPVSREPGRGDDMDFEQVIYEKSDAIATITLNRPERMNAFTPKMLDEWHASLLDAHLDPEVGVVIVTGSGRGFCTGADIRGTGPLEDLLCRNRTPVEHRNFL